MPPILRTIDFCPHLKCYIKGISRTIISFKHFKLDESIAIRWQKNVFLGGKRHNGIPICAKCLV